MPFPNELKAVGITPRHITVISDRLMADRAEIETDAVAAVPGLANESGKVDPQDLQDAIAAARGVLNGDDRLVAFDPKGSTKGAGGGDAPDEGVDVSTFASAEPSAPPGGERAEEVDPFDPASLRMDTRTSDETLGVERPLLVVPVRKPSKQSFIRVNPDPTMRLTAAVVEMEQEREMFLVTPAIAQLIPGETKLVQLLACTARVGGPFLWPLKLPGDDGRPNPWHASAAKAAEIAETKWVRVQANMALGAYDVTTSSHIPDPVWPNHTMGQLLKIAFGDGRLVDREDHPVIRQLQGMV